MVGNIQTGQGQSVSGVQLMQECLQSQKNTLRCPISRERMKEPVITSCGHSFEKEVILKWINGSTQPCPTCRSNITTRDLAPNLALRELSIEYKENKLKFRMASQNMAEVSTQPSEGTFALTADSIAAIVKNAVEEATEPLKKEIRSLSERVQVLEKENGRLTRENTQLRQQGPLPSSNSTVTTPSPKGEGF